ncbi:MAG: hypothetical protein K8S56_06310, partial [Candidatus Cloacimonetes bacterium]|nr:hypothetical protein [Candidatus Cloacimonadota bacterium]
EPNPLALIELSMFDYPLQNHSLDNNFNQLDNHSYLVFDETGCREIEYYTYKPFIENSGSLSWQQTYEQTPVIFNNIMDTITANLHKLNSALTSGFDSRTVLSNLYHQDVDTKYYSWGKPGSFEIEIPKRISRKLGLDYRSILFEKKFIDDYSFYADQTAYWTDGTGNAKRTNVMYSHSQLTSFSRNMMTGYFGSEILRPVAANTTILRPALVKLFFSKYPEKVVEELYQREVKKGFFTTEWLQKHKEEVIDNSLTFYKKSFIYDKRHRDLYHFMLKDTLRKFFGQEYHSCRIHSCMHTPYFDDEFVEFIAQTPIPDLEEDGMDSKSCNLRLGQLFYTPILEKNLPQLMKMITGRLYSPAAVKSPLYPLTVLPGYGLYRFKNKFSKYFPSMNVFSATLWNKNLYKAHSEVFEDSREFLSPVNWKEQQGYSELGKHFAMRRWLSDKI